MLHPSMFDIANCQSKPSMATVVRSPSVESGPALLLFASFTLTFACMYLIPAFVIEEPSQERSEEGCTAAVCVQLNGKLERRNS